MRNRNLLYTCLLSAFATQATAATIVIDGGLGFDDPTLSSSIPNQVGNNLGTTLGEMRLIVFQQAAAVWGGILNSNVTITVHVDFVDDIACGASSATLGNAGPTSASTNFPGGDPNIAHPIALAESISGSNRNGASAEINSNFNAKVDNDPACLGGEGFYYGLDNNAANGTSPIFATVLHEIGHGLGFLSLVNDDGSLFNGRVDSFTRELMDLQTGKNWADMTNGERMASALNEPNLVWVGPQVTADFDEFLAPAPVMQINAPAPIGTFDVVTGDQSAPIPGGQLTLPVVDGNSLLDIANDPATGCTQLDFAGTLLNGKIVLFDATNDCPVVVQVVFSEFAGAEGVIIADTSGVGFPDVSGLIVNDIFIPYVGIQKSEADQLRSNIGVANVTLKNSATKFVGENQGKVKMYAPGVLEVGSSVSHWSRTASPDLLMEPALGDLGFGNVDLTAAAFKDIGWSVNIPGAVLEIIYEDGFE